MLAFIVMTAIVGVARFAGHPDLMYDPARHAGRLHPYLDNEGVPLLVVRQILFIF